MVYKVSQSKTKTFLACRRSYFYKYVVELKKKVKSRPLYFGTLIHQMLEAEANGIDPVEPLTKAKEELNKGGFFAQEREEHLATIQAAEDIGIEYFRYWDSEPDHLVMRRIKGKSAEHQFEIEIFPDVIWNGKIDGIATRKGLLWAVEHKTFSRAVPEDERWRNLQSVTYFRANDILGWKPLDGVVWDYVWSKEPALPKLTKTGAVSHASIDTLPRVYRRFMKSLGLAPQKEFIQKLKARRKEWFYRIHTPVDRHTVDVIFDQFLHTIQEMVELHSKTQEESKYPMHIGRHCSWCDYEPLCRARLQNTDHGFLAEKLYKPNKKGEEDAGFIHKVQHSKIPE